LKNALVAFFNLAIHAMSQPVDKINRLLSRPGQSIARGPRESFGSVFGVWVNCWTSAAGALLPVPNSLASGDNLAVCSGIDGCAGNPCDP
jgi:hypothetical protein